MFKGILLSNKKVIANNLYRRILSNTLYNQNKIILKYNQNRCFHSQKLIDLRSNGHFNNLTIKNVIENEKLNSIIINHKKFYSDIDNSNNKNKINENDNLKNENNKTENNGINSNKENLNENNKLKSETSEENEKIKENSSNETKNSNNYEKQNGGKTNRYTPYVLIGGISIGIGIGYFLNTDNQIKEKISDLYNNFQNERQIKKDKMKNNKIRNSEEDYDIEKNENFINERNQYNSDNNEERESRSIHLKIYEKKTNNKKKEKGKRKEDSQINNRDNNEKDKDNNNDNNINIEIDNNDNKNEKNRNESMPNESNSFSKSITNMYNSIWSFFGYETPKVPIEELKNVSDIDKEIEEIYTSILNELGKEDPDIKIYNLRNNESVKIGKEEFESEEARKNLEEKLKSWGNIESNNKNKNTNNAENKTQLKNNKNKLGKKSSNNKLEKNASISTATTSDTLKNENEKYIDVKEDFEAKKKIIKFSTKPIAKAFHEASKISESLGKNKDKLPDYLADCVRDSTQVMVGSPSSSDPNNKNEERNLFLETINIFSNSMNAISDYLDQLEIEIKTDIDEDNTNNTNEMSYE